MLLIIQHNTAYHVLYIYTEQTARLAKQGVKLVVLPSSATTERTVCKCLAQCYIKVEQGLKNQSCYQI